MTPAPAAPPDRPRILYIAPASVRKPDRVQAVLDTWARALPPGDRLVFLGDTELARELGEGVAWPCVKSGDPEDSYEMLPRKFLAGLDRARSERRWDFLMRVDDDTYVVPARVSAILAELDPGEPLYAGGVAYDVRSETFPDSHRTRLARGEPAIGWIGFVGGAGFACTRPALERAWPYVQQELSVHGHQDDIFLCAALHRAGVPARRLGPFFHGDRLLDRLLFSCAATVHHVSPDDLRFLHRIVGDYATPFEVAHASLGWGEVGVNGWLGFAECRVSVGGRPHRRAIGAHAHSSLVLRGPPGLALDLKGALDDTASPGRPARFSVHRRDGGQVVDLGEAVRGRTTPLVRVAFPGDGRLVLRAHAANPTGCHTVWLWNNVQ